MRKILFFLFLLTPQIASAEVNVFACEPEWGAVAKEIGGDKVTVKTATTAKQNVHHIQAKPSLIAGVRNADMIFCTGAELEVGWLPVLLEQAGNAKIQPGGEASLYVADYVNKLEIPTKLDRADGDVHAQGNPHIQTDPRNIAIAAKIFAEKISKLDSANSAYYESRYKDFDKRWQAAIKKWEGDAADLKNMPIAVQHNSWVYLVNWLGLKVVTSLEPKPGVPPTSSYLAEVLERTKAQPVKAIIYAAFEDPSSSNWLSDKTKIPAIELPYTVGGNEQSQDLFGLFDSTISQLKKANNE